MSSAQKLIPLWDEPHKWIGGHVSQRFGTTGDCSSVISTFCSSLAVDIVGYKFPITNHVPFIVALQIAVSDTLTHCYNLHDGLRCDFGMVNMGNATDAPSVVNCRLILNQVSAECPAGGLGNVVGLPFKFQVDPNESACVVIPPGD
ncbi:hypothetical protein C8J57DRAFT_1569105 [Mycena rebaudengoi]|nr:hypothetical protein C8J57DRAFT_1569105 [Mycena rebaudengoi]